MNKSANDNRSDQLNPNNLKFVKARGSSINDNVVAKVQRVEIHGTGKQVKGGPGAIAQSYMNSE